MGIPRRGGEVARRSASSQRQLQARRLLRHAQRRPRVVRHEIQEALTYLDGASAQRSSACPSGRPANRLNATGHDFGPGAIWRGGDPS